MTVGVMLPRDLAPEQVLSFAEAAEQLGFAQLWVVEDWGFRGGIAQAAAVLAATGRITVGVGILPAAARNAAFTAMELATLAELFPGRVIAGIGHGMPDWMRQVGARVASPLTLLAEHLAAVRALLRGERVSTEGRYVRLTDAVLTSPPSVVPPVLAGVRGPKSLAVSGKHADGTLLAEPVTPEYLASAKQHIAAGGPHQLVAYAVAAVGPDSYDMVRPALEWIGEPDWAPHLAPTPFADEVARLRAAASSRAEFAASLPDDLVAKLAIAGPLDVARRRIGELHEAGADVVVLVPAGPLPDLAQLV
ncbi:LLM class flavin-dependent oxidoreductase [Labedaea rhizosphaerae]|uniref:Alkanesulfonate monooxygenase SsuD/methylene tetrahydromethanopterin reductase-like flavin-dependent oxidoreductase (Luciferase family) n=1 Tax=Labedaea rhizosphaerae TaxID=598644 RepID=A0A4R6SKC2_LABRH|nr:LLM class flavin-dependent oxidoreductase [Labedaea rhizosphaerae]TDQ01488.1 alkanesulfonate monooxygenase SsuD/methylene tetrahydromethanopterin reductase-like flavin-dependent oxidoreductase (luciferase family) [Labedaea rhizosphaerae]